MNRMSKLMIGMATTWLAIVGGLAVSAQDKYTVKVPGGLAFSEFRGYEAWQAISISRNERVVAMILGNPLMIDAYRAGIPANGQPVPDGAKMAKVHWTPKPNEFFPEATVPGSLLNVDFMVRTVRGSRTAADGDGPCSIEGGKAWERLRCVAEANNFRDETADYSDDAMHAALDVSMPNYAAIVTTSELVESMASLVQVHARPPAAISSKGPSREGSSPWSRVTLLNCDT